MTGARWLLVSTRPVPGFEATLSSAVDGPALVYSAGAFDALAGCGLAVSVTSTDDEDDGADTTIVVGSDTVRVRVSQQNTTPVYLAADPAGGHILIGDDLPVTAAALAAVTGVPADLRSSTFIHHGPESSVRGVRRLEHGTDLVLQRVDGAWQCRVTRRPEVPLDVPIRFRDPLTAGRAQIEALRTAIHGALAAEPAAGVLVSGGVDSGVVAALLAETGKPATAYSIGTAWGNEFEHAQDTAAATGLALRHVRLSEEDIEQALPATVRAFGHGDPEAVAIGVALTAFCEGAHAQERLLLTGYGSDLVNSGMATTDEIDGDIGAKVRDAMHRTRYSSEFTSTAAARRGYRMFHPYWHPGVLDAALATDPAAKAFRGREKGHLRLAAGELLPDVVAWRSKTAIHHGNGLGANLARLIDSHTGVADSAAAVYRAMLAHQIDAAAQDPSAHPSGGAVYEQAVEAVVRANHDSPVTQGGKR
jgi:asparagine synthetase B (glutamine-hydrolysing)